MAKHLTQYKISDAITIGAAVIEDERNLMRKIYGCKTEEEIWTQYHIHALRKEIKHLMWLENNPPDYFSEDETQFYPHSIITTKKQIAKIELVLKEGKGFTMEPIYRTLREKEPPPKMNTIRALI